MPRFLGSRLSVTGWEAINVIWEVAKSWLCKTRNMSLKMARVMPFVFDPIGRTYGITGLLSALEAQYIKCRPV